MKLPFIKYHGSGNDFIMVDDRKATLNLSREQIIKLCHRHFGIGSDGIILIREHASCDYEMVFYNPDGSMSLCGNGSRCALDFANHLGITAHQANFMAIDGMHKARIEGKDMCIQLHDIGQIEKGDGFYFLNNGSPHHVIFTDKLDDIDVYSEGRKIRYSDKYGQAGTNVNFVEIKSTGVIRSRVYERGVENETFSSGTGTSAQALCAHIHMGWTGSEVKIETRGGDLKVLFNHVAGTQFRDIWLKGPVVAVYTGTIDV